jgi:hypothetical protein
MQISIFIVNLSDCCGHVGTIFLYVNSNFLSELRVDLGTWVLSSCCDLAIVKVISSDRYLLGLVLVGKLREISSILVTFSWCDLAMVLMVIFVDRSWQMGLFQMSMASTQSTS